MIHVFIISGQIWGPLNSMSDTTTSSSFVIDATATNFEKDVIERSHSIPVVIDFWASWCGPCLALGPVLEKLAREYDGKFLLAKVNTDKETELAHQFGVRSIPAVFGVRDGKPVDAFVGVQPESVIRTWLDRLMPTPAETLAAEAGLLERSDPRAAEEKYSAALALDHDLTAAQIGLARIALEQGRLEDVQARILGLERRGFLEPEAEKIKAELKLRLQAGGVGSVESARAALAVKPDDPTLKFQLAEALAAAGQYEEALAICLDLVERDRRGIGEKARQTMVAIFQLLPPDSELAIENQRQLSLALTE
jgi:putative thioredoxin